MKIGITCYPTYGGSGAIATELGLALAHRGHDVHLISYASPFRLRGFEERLTFHEVTIGNYPLFEYLPYDLALAVKQHEVALREGLEILHVHYAIPHATAAWLAKQMLGNDHPLKVITTLHGTDITLVGQERSYHSVTKFSIERSDAVTAVSRFLRDETYRAFGPIGCEIRVIPNFVNLAEYHPADTSAEECRPRVAPKGDRVLIHVSNFREVKRVRDVVRIFAGVRQAIPATLLMVGDGPERPDAEDEADRLGVTRHVRFLGKVNSVAELLRCSDLLLLPSQTESFGLVALEALASGVPVVASDIGGLPELVTPGTGALAPVGAVEEMTRHAVQILQDPKVWRVYSDAAARRAQDYSAETVVPQYEALYTELLRG